MRNGLRAYRGRGDKAACVFELGLVETVRLFTLRVPRFSLTRNTCGLQNSSQSCEKENSTHYSCQELNSSS